MRWHKLSVEWPKEDGKYIVYAPDPLSTIPWKHVAYYTNHHWNGIAKEWADRITFWMPMPLDPADD